MSDHTTTKPPAPPVSTEQTVEELLAQHPEVARQLRSHWLSFAVGLVGLLLVTLLVQLQLLPFLGATPAGDGLPPTLTLVLLALHTLLCLVAVVWHFSGVGRFRQDVGSDAKRLRVILAYLQKRRRLVLGLALTGQLVVLIAGFQGLSFAVAGYLIVPLVPTFLLLSLSLRQPPTQTHLASHVRRLRTLQQTREL